MCPGSGEMKYWGRVPFGEAFGAQELLYEVMGNLHNSGVAIIVVVVVAGVMVVGLYSGHSCGT